MTPDMKEVRGIPKVVAAVKKAIVTRKHLLLCGPPGIGKTMVARRIPTIMPPLDKTSLETLAVIYARANLAPVDDEDWVPTRPFRAPHHSISTAGLVGSRKNVGELELAIYGVLFLDELSEFQAGAIRTLGSVLRRGGLPVLIIATANPCPCGWNGYSDMRVCNCSSAAIFRFRTRVQASCKELNIEDFVDIPSLNLKAIETLPPGEDSETIRYRITMQMGES